MPRVHDWPELLLPIFVLVFSLMIIPNSLDGSLWMVGIIIEWVSLPCSCTIKWWNEFHSIVRLDKPHWIDVANSSMKTLSKYKNSLAWNKESIMQQ